MFSLIISITSFLFVSCSESSFKGGAPAPVQVIPDPLNAQTAQPDVVRFNVQEITEYPVDIFFLIDSSQSMSQYASRVRQNLPILIQAFAAQKNSNYNYRIFIVHKNPSLPSDEEGRIYGIAHRIGSHDALSVGRNLIEAVGHEDESPEGIRRRSVKEFVVASDDDSSENPMAFREWAMNAASQWGPIHVSGIVRLGGPCGGILSYFSDAKPGKTYQAISQLTETRGVIGELCSNNWAGVFQNLSNQLIERKQIARTGYRIPRPVLNADYLQVHVDGQRLKLGQDWVYDLPTQEVRILRNMDQAQVLEIFIHE